MEDKLRHNTVKVTVEPQQTLTMYTHYETCDNPVKKRVTKLFKKSNSCHHRFRKYKNTSIYPLMGHHYTKKCSNDILNTMSSSSLEYLSPMPQNVQDLDVRKLKLFLDV